jgi:outer membrane protein OmpA-like peptidoglycan-associated protein
MRWQQLTRLPCGPAIPFALCLLLSACATSDSTVGPGEAKGPLGGPGSPSQTAKAAPPGLPAPGSDVEVRPRPEEGTAPNLDRKDNVYFSQGSADIDDAGRETIRQHAEKLKSNRRLVVTLIGHSTDRGSTEYKVALGQKRVDLVADELKSAGAATVQIRKRSYASDKATADRCASEACRQTDRRVELRYIDLTTPPSRRVP